ncbi:hypothetical protein AB0939_22905 [Streptomyces sp. NPDC006990]|uniref:hypothetical protein n=1 Tax=Streptomyces sp. NPDC006990 TaxID=3154481 RepID=UPI003455DC20
MGVGRFVYTPILPLMRERAELSSAFGANLATCQLHRPPPRRPRRDRRPRPRTVGGGAARIAPRAGRHAGADAGHARRRPVVRAAARGGRGRRADLRDRQALLLGSVMVALAGATAAAICVRFPYHLAPAAPTA